jgi:hypothetical protein
VASMREMRNAYRILVRKPKVKKVLGKYCRWKDIKIELKEIACENMDRIHLAQNTDQWQAPTNVVDRNFGLLTGRRISCRGKLLLGIICLLIMLYDPRNGDCRQSRILRLFLRL